MRRSRSLDLNIPLKRRELVKYVLDSNMSLREGARGNCGFSLEHGSYQDESHQFYRPLNNKNMLLEAIFRQFLKQQANEGQNLKP